MCVCSARKSSESNRRAKRLAQELPADVLGSFPAKHIITRAAQLAGSPGAQRRAPKVTARPALSQTMTQNLRAASFDIARR
jgi:hypothetical protein